MKLIIHKLKNFVLREAKLGESHELGVDVRIDKVEKFQVYLQGTMLDLRLDIDNLYHKLHPWISHMEDEDDNYDEEDSDEEDSDEEDSNER